jgi:hypothetical protein
LEHIQIKSQIVKLRKELILLVKFKANHNQINFIKHLLNLFTKVATNKKSEIILTLVKKINLTMQVILID